MSDFNIDKHTNKSGTTSQNCQNINARTNDNYHNQNHKRLSNINFFDYNTLNFLWLLKGGKS